VCWATIREPVTKSIGFQYVRIQIIGFAEYCIIVQIINPKADEWQGTNPRYQHQEYQSALLLTAAPKHLERQHTHEINNEADPRQTRKEDGDDRQDLCSDHKCVVGPDMRKYEFIICLITGNRTMHVSNFPLDRQRREKSMSKPMNKRIRKIQLVRCDHVVGIPHSREGNQPTKLTHTHREGYP